MPDRYHIKDGYVAQTVALTRERSAGEYWTAERLDAAGAYQLAVYERAAALADEHGYTRIADFGCGPGDKLQRFFGPHRPVGFDQATLAGVVAQRNPDVLFRAIDLESPSGVLDPDERFDLTICADVLEHLIDPDPAIEVLRRHTAGVVVLSTPDRDVVRGPDAMGLEKPEHVREWNRGEFADYLTSRGLDIVLHELVSKTGGSQSPSGPRSCQLVVARPTAFG